MPLLLLPLLSESISPALHLQQLVQDELRIVVGNQRQKWISILRKARLLIIVSTTQSIIILRSLRGSHSNTIFVEVTTLWIWSLLIHLI